MFKTASLPPEIANIIRNKETEHPFSGDYDNFDQPGTYLCRQCGLALFRADSKFHSGCGWPSFDQAIAQNVKQLPDADGRRTEILCARCEGHLGHVFHGENFTTKNMRHCVNSLSLDFVADKNVLDTEEAIFAAGCFWGVEYYFERLPGVLKTEVGYSGGQTNHPTYKQICNENTGHFEVIRVVYDPTKINYEALTQFFFEIHDPCQHDGQGPDRGHQYLSVIFYYNATQKKTAEQLIKFLESQGNKIATKILPVTIFWRAEEYHQRYYDKQSKLPYCHRYEKRNW